MARFSRLHTLTAMKDTGLVPVFYHSNVDTAVKIVDACARGGAVTLEFTNRGDGAVSVFEKLEEYCRERIPEVILGVGSVVDAPTSAQYINAGANFVVGPVLDEETAFVCNARKVPYSPGCGSATEIARAHQLGVEICKIFPGDLVGGPGFVKAVRGPMPWTELMPTGGVDPTEESLTAWFSAGVCCVGIGSKLLTKELIQQGDFDGIRKNVHTTIDIIKKIRGAA
ncbi:MAG: bifunctional 4-hydroxy-2-oxoglutarate aldolase/2-dehydro-3-deoxy-phosphogluconate aldolase [Deltaproteobacteria bacterium]|nr:bifunctional 4-hydroxy-2-oxoglutarate aldolase/2-dehydro-3-deoxy-phosphogluconate aldolase [Candidatus Zymogenaceae bacterium]